MANLSFCSQFSGLRLNYFRRFWNVGVTVAATTLLLLLAAVEIQSQTSQNAGYVLSVNGNWKSNKSPNNLKQFQPLPGGAKVFAAKPITKESFITIALFDGKTIRRRCNQGACGKSIDVPNVISAPVTKSPSITAAPAARAAEPPVMTSVAAALKSLFHSHGTYFISVIIREGATGDLREAVLESSLGQVKLGPAFTELPAARYHLVLNKLREDQPDMSIKSLSMDVNWDPNQPDRAKAALDPGLYHLIGPGNLQSWVLVTSSDQYAEANVAFAKALAMSKEWTNEVDAAASRMFLRAFLATLAKGGEKSPD